MLHKKNPSLLRLVFLSVSLLLAAGSPAFCQDNDPRDLESRDIPTRLKPDFERRLSQFIEYQRTGQWDKLPDYLVNFQPDGYGGKIMDYTPEQINNQVESLKKKQVLDFTVLERAGDFYTRTPLNRRVYQLWGCAKFKEGDQTFKAEALILVYYVNQTFVFSPVKLGKPSTDGSTDPCQKRTANR